MLTDVLLETLAIVAYKQPVTKIEIEKIRGVKSDHAVNKLVEYDLVCEVGSWMRRETAAIWHNRRIFATIWSAVGGGASSIAPEQLEDFKEEAEREIKDRLDV